jgi:non-ribosomal peptide synthetase component F
VSKFDLTLGLREVGDRIEGTITYATALFDRATIERYIGYFRNVLVGFTTDDTGVVTRLPLLSPQERDQALERWNATTVEYASEMCLHHFLELQTRVTPDALALRCGEQTLTYAELDSQASQLAQVLQAAGVGPDARVGICLDRTCDLPIDISPRAVALYGHR